MKKGKRKEGKSEEDERYRKWEDIRKITGIGNTIFWGGEEGGRRKQMGGRGLIKAFKKDCSMQFWRGRRKRHFEHNTDHCLYDICPLGLYESRSF